MTQIISQSQLLIKSNINTSIAPFINAIGHHFISPGVKLGQKIFSNSNFGSVLTSQKQSLRQPSHKCTKDKVVILYMQHKFFLQYRNTNKRRKSLVLHVHQSPQHPFLHPAAHEPAEHLQAAPHLQPASEMYIVRTLQ